MLSSSTHERGGTADKSARREKAEEFAPCFSPSGFPHTRCDKIISARGENTVGWQLVFQGKKCRMRDPQRMLLFIQSESIACASMFPEVRSCNHDMMHEYMRDRPSRTKPLSIKLQFFIWLRRTDVEVSPVLLASLFLSLYFPHGKNQRRKDGQWQAKKKISCTLKRSRNQGMT